MEEKQQFVGIAKKDYLQLMEFIMGAPYGYVKKHEELIDRLRKSEVFTTSPDEEAP